MTRDPWDNHEARRWRDRANRELLPMIRDSACSITIAPETPDAKIAVELGYCILLDKPIVILAPRGRHIPERLRRVADKIVWGHPSEPGVRQQIEAFINEVKAGDHGPT